jgi:pimeloyl-ACP methyl ester carboxylesterase
MSPSIIHRSRSRRQLSGRVTPLAYLRRVRGGHILICLLAVGCASPADDFGRRVVDLGMISEIRRGAPLEHVIVRRPGPASPRWHVYLDGDGTPWFGGLPARDPTPRAPLALALMARDPANSVYLGRPCYHGLAGSEGCTSQLWTSARYSETVVASMAAVLRDLMTAGGVDEIDWFGYSGGGSLAVLLAPRFPESRVVVTVAANLDIDAWADGHRDPRLKGSLNPARQPPLPDRIQQFHYAGGRDRVVPVDVVRRGAVGAAQLIVVPDHDHVCCWERAWPAILAEVERAARAAPLR